MREAVVENEFVKAVRKAGGVAYKLTSQTTNGLPDRLVLFFPAKTVFAELKAPGKMLRPLQRKRRYQLQKLGFPVLCIDRLSQIKPAIRAIVDWTPGEPFPEGIGAAGYVQQRLRGVDAGASKGLSAGISQCAGGDLSGELP